jgi:DNA topoisomerase-1
VGIGSGPSGHGFAAARHARLRYTSSEQPGIRRLRKGRGFAYVARGGEPIRDEAELRRIRHLAIPPAWTDVWISPSPIGHIQATGRDARGRKQYRYHERWREVRDEAKYDRLGEFAKALPRIRDRVDADLARPGITRERVVATAIRVLEQTLMRVGNVEYARSNGSFGLTTLRARHVDIEGSRIAFHFRGKGGKEYDVDVRDRRLARVVARLEQLPGQEIFRYRDDDGELRTIGSDDVNVYLRDASGEDLTAKDFRTWAGTVLAARALAEAGPARTERVARKRIVEAIDIVSARLGNTRAVCRKCYIHPAVLEAYSSGELPLALRRPERLRKGEKISTHEAAVAAMLARAANGPRAARRDVTRQRERGRARTGDGRPAPGDRDSRERRRP